MFKLQKNLTLIFVNPQLILANSFHILAVEKSHICESITLKVALGENLSQSERH